MKRSHSSNGQELREMFIAGTTWLEKSVADIDAINVFPVPDGDTGTNMLLTMRSALDEAHRVPDPSSASSIAKAMAYGALMGARGNSGIILSQILRGLDRGLESKESFTAGDLASAFQEAAAMARNGLTRPVEGTILTVIRDVASAATSIASCGAASDLSSLMEAVVAAAKESVARTPTLLPVLREAGVVDAGGQGLYVILEGALHYLRGNTEVMQYRKPQIAASSIPLASRADQFAEREEPYGYCMEFLIEGHRLKPDKISKRLEGRGQSLIVVGDDNTVRVHIHTLDPGAVLHYAVSLGTLHQIRIQNMDDQYMDFMEMQKGRASTADIAIIPVVVGDGFMKVFRSLGATSIVPGGRTMNPSVRDLLRAIESVRADKVILLPSNKNVILTATQAASLTLKKVIVVPTRSIPQSVAALLAFNYELDVEENAEVMEEVASRVKTVEIARAAHPTQIGGLKIRRGQAIGLLDDDLVAAGDDILEVLIESLNKAGIEEAGVATIYYGADTQQSDAEGVAERIRRDHPQIQVEVVRGDQPHYNYIVSLE
ncbi:MAG: DAK2 domain-containing protein [bacterium]